MLPQNNMVELCPLDPHQIQWTYPTSQGLVLADLPLRSCVIRGAPTASVISPATSTAEEAVSEGGDAMAENGCEVADDEDGVE